jgi:beta-fructofuranosidase
MKIPPVYKPVISGDWQLLFRPQKTGCYVNDHTLLRAHDGLWHLFGITRDRSEIRPDHERYFAHGAGPSLLSQTGLEEKEPACDFGLRAWAPALVRAHDRYYMFYGPDSLHLAVSDELYEWRKTEVNQLGCPIDGCIRDPMLLQTGPDSWLLYATALHAGYGQVSVFISNDLINWRFVQFALRTSGKAPLNPAWGATESPFVVLYQGWYYLLVTYTDSEMDSYHNTLVFHSLNPFDFGEYTGDNADDVVMARLHAHAPELVHDVDQDAWYITTCGWRGRNTPIEGAVAIAPLRWESVPA